MTQVSQLFHLFLTMQIYSVVKQKNPLRAYSHTVHQHCGSSFNLHYSRSKKVTVPSSIINCWRNDYSFVPIQSHNNATTLNIKLVGRNGYNWYNHRHKPRQRSRMHAAIDVAAAVDVINDLGLDTLTFLAVTVIVVPLFRRIKASPVRMISPFFFSTYCSYFVLIFSLIQNLTICSLFSDSWFLLCWDCT